jgi:hypothetical protein
MNMMVQFRNYLSPMIPGFRDAVNKEFELLKARKLTRRNRAKDTTAIDAQVNYIDESINKK